MPRASSTAASSRGRKTAPPPSGLLQRHARDLWTIGLLVVGIFIALAEFSALGALGHWLEVGLADLLGISRASVPVALVAVGGALLSRRVVLDRLRLGLGLGLGVAALSGCASFAGGDPGFSAPRAAIAGSGGYLGLGIGAGLRAGVGSPGTVVILVAALVLAVVFLTGQPLTRLAHGLVIGLTSLLRGGRAAARAIPRRAERPPVEAPPVAPRSTEPAPSVDDEADLAVAAGLVEVTEPPVEDDPEVAPVFAPGHMSEDDESAEPAEEPPPAPERVPVTVVRHQGSWTLPSLDLLQRVREQRLDKAAVSEAGQELVAALAAHGVETALVGYTVGPTVTRFELELGPGVRVASVTSLHRDIAYAMASPDVRILAPIPGRSAIGVEVPNRQRVLVALGDLLASEEATAAHHPLDVPIGRDISGKTVVVNLGEMPHVLISGATGSGKSSCINSLITSLVMRATPEELRLILVDPKRVELGQYNDLPHLLAPVVVDPKKAAQTLGWAVKEMERRYDVLAEYHVRDIQGYHELRARGVVAEPTTSERVAGAIEAGSGVSLPAEAAEAMENLPYIVIVVDELNDLMMVAAREVEDSVVRIAQMARAVGIHLVLATQRPSVDVITGVIKANIPSRMAFAVSSLADSRVILDQAGAERLIGKGDVLLLTATSNVARRLQSPWVSEEEVRRVVEAWRAQGGTTETVVAVGEDGEDGGAGYAGNDEDDEAVLAKARELVIRTQSGSTSMLQRKLRIGFARAGRIMDELEKEGVVGPGEGSKARKVNITLDQFSSGQWPGTRL